MDKRLFLLTQYDDSTVLVIHGERLDFITLGIGLDSCSSNSLADQGSLNGSGTFLRQKLVDACITCLPICITRKFD